jgi:hypothetical protein
MDVKSGKPRLGGRGFFMSSSIVADWVKLICKRYWFVFMELGGLWLDKVFAGVLVVCSENEQRQPAYEAGSELASCSIKARAGWENLSFHSIAALLHVLGCEIIPDGAKLPTAAGDS